MLGARFGVLLSNRCRCEKWILAAKNVFLLPIDELRIEAIARGGVPDGGHVGVPELPQQGHFREGAVGSFSMDVDLLHVAALPT